MATAKEEALACHAKGYNCAQSVLIANQSRTNFTEEDAAAIAAGLGGGARCRELCGAVNGAIITFGRSLQQAGRSSEMTRIQKEYLNRFQSHFGALRCADLKAKRISCDDIISYSAELTEELLDEALKIKGINHLMEGNTGNGNL